MATELHLQFNTAESFKGIVVLLSAISFGLLRTCCLFIYLFKGYERM